MGHRLVTSSDRVKDCWRSCVRIDVSARPTIKGEMRGCSAMPDDNRPEPELGVEWGSVCDCLVDFPSFLSPILATDSRQDKKSNGERCGRAYGLRKLSAVPAKYRAIEARWRASSPRRGYVSSPILCANLSWHLPWLEGGYQVIAGRRRMHVLPYARIRSQG